MSRLFRLAYASLLLVFVAVPAEAKEGEAVQYSHVDVGLALAWFGYNESDIVQYGFLEGVDLKAKLSVPAKHLWNAYPALMLEGDLLGGLLTYDGESLNGDPIHTGSADLLGNIRALMGVDLLVGSARLMPYWGLGVRYWFDDIQDSEGYPRWSRFLYLPVGLEMGFSTTRKDEFGIRSEFAPIVMGWVSTYLEEVDSDLQDAHNTKGLGSGFGLNNSAFYTTHLSSGNSLTWEAFFRYWVSNKSRSTTLQGDDPRTNTVETEYEYSVPYNSTAMYGLRISIGF